MNDPREDPQIRKILQQLVETGEELVDMLPPDLGLQVELCLGELAVLLGRTEPIVGKAMMSRAGPEQDDKVN
jgi:hypothetical protein